jgi:hypothetical protein
VIASSSATVYSDPYRAYDHTKRPENRALVEWLLPSFRSLWLNEQRPLSNCVSTASLNSFYEDTGSSSSFVELSSRMSPRTLAFAGSVAASLRASALAILEWIEDREYEREFEQHIEPIPRAWVKRLTRFKAGPEISVRWDDDE